MRYIDTCALLNLSERAFDEPFIISYITIQELENIKVSSGKDSDVKYKSRVITRLLDANMDKFTVCFDGKDECIKQGIDSSCMDNIILQGAILTNKTSQILFITDDLLLKIKGKNAGLTVVGSADILGVCDSYLGYKTVTYDDDEMANFYMKPCENTSNCITNEYLIVKNSTGQVVDKRKWDGESYLSLSYKAINNEFLGKIKPINAEQELAFDLLQDTTSRVKVLAGSAGTGKDYLMISNALQLIKQNKFKKILWVRNNIEVKNTKQIGFLPGNKKDKLEAFAMPLADHLGGKDGLDMLINQGKIEVEHLGFLRGRDLRESIVYCSECENCTTEIVQLLLGRIGEDSMLWLNGDYRQVDDKCFENNNGLKSAINKLKGNDLFGYVNLCKIERSKTAQLAELLY